MRTRREWKLEENTNIKTVMSNKNMPDKFILATVLLLFSSLVIAQDAIPGSVEDMIGTIIGWIISILLFLIVIAFMLWVLYKIYKTLLPSEKKQDVKEHRKLSAIIFTDMKDYSKEMGLDEEATLKKLWRYEKAMK
jgi:uncharacterized membrane protein